MKRGKRSGLSKSLLAATTPVPGTPSLFSPSHHPTILTRTRLLIHYFFAATTTLLHHTTLHPSHPLARSDIQLIEPFLGLLELLAKEGKSEEVGRMYAFCQDMNVKAKEAVEHVNMKMICGDGRGKERGERGAKESVEEFIMRVECQSKGCPSAGEFVPAGRAVPGIEPWETFGAGGDGLDFEMLGQ
jgi:hypothetical protein